MGQAMTVEKFHALHPFKTSDGRRWASIECAAHSARHSVATGLTAVDMRNGQYFSHNEICSFYRMAPQPYPRAGTIRDRHEDEDPAKRTENPV